MSVGQLQAGHEQAWRAVYSARGTWRRLRHTAAPMPAAVLANLGYRYYAKRLHRFYTCDLPASALGRASRVSRVTGS
jgi:hypothetical protein